MPTQHPLGRASPVAKRLQKLRHAMTGSNQARFAQRYGFASLQAWNNLERGYPLTHIVALRLVQRIPGLSLDWLHLGRTGGLSVAMARKMGVDLTSGDLLDGQQEPLEDVPHVSEYR